LRGAVDRKTEKLNFAPESNVQTQLIPLDGTMLAAGAFWQ
jgi:hypothetical protein